MPELARWIRTQLREGGDGSQACGAALRAAAAAASSRCPQRLLLAVGSSAAGRHFLEQCLSRYEDALRAASETDRRCSRLHSALSSVHEALGHTADAIRHARHALRADGVLPPLRTLASAETSGDTAEEAQPPCFGHSPLDTELRAALEHTRSRSASVRSRLSTLIRLRRQQRCDVAVRASLSSGAAAHGAAAHASAGEVPASPVPRADAGLSVSDFAKRFLSSGTPVVLPLPAGAGPTPAWDLDFLSSALGSISADLKQRVSGSVHWAGLEPSAALNSAPAQPPTVRDFIASLGDSPTVIASLGDFSAQIPTQSQQSAIPQSASATAAAAADGQPTSSSTAVAAAAAAAAAASKADVPLASSSSSSPQPPINYLFDWSMPQHCPSLLPSLTVPRYFAADLLQQTAEGSFLREAWPSLFIGGTRTAYALSLSTLPSRSPSASRSPSLPPSLSPPTRPLECWHPRCTPLAQPQHQGASPPLLSYHYP